MRRHPLFQHVGRFLADHVPARSRRVAVAVSGGRDSLLLLACAVDAWRAGELESVRALVVHHGTRVGQTADGEWVRGLAARWRVACQELHLGEPAPRANVEQVLRQRRHVALKKALLPGEDLWMGHHLDDSWEWSQLQAARSGDWRSALGIPLRSGPVLRPFLCVTRSQITRAARALGLAWREDPTNADPRFERNWWRREVAPRLKRRHPGYLKHYARRQQHLAERLGLALKPAAAAVYPHADGLLVDGTPSAGDLRGWVAKFGRGDRGRSGGEVEKLLRASRAGKRGPFRLSGGVEVHLWDGWLTLVPAGHRFRDQEASRRRALARGQERSWTREEFLDMLRTRAARPGAVQEAPFWIWFSPEQNGRNVLVSAGRDPSWPLTTARGEGAVMSAFKLLRRWRDPSLALRFVPLFSLE